MGKREREREREKEDASSFFHIRYSLTDSLTYSLHSLRNKSQNIQINPPLFSHMNIYKCLSLSLCFFPLPHLPSAKPQTPLLKTTRLNNNHNDQTSNHQS